MVISYQHDGQLQLVSEVAAERRGNLRTDPNATVYLQQPIYAYMEGEEEKMCC